MAQDIHRKRHERPPPTDPGGCRWDPSLERSRVPRSPPAAQRGDRFNPHFPICLPTNTSQLAMTMVYNNLELETPTGRSWSSPVLKKPAAKASSTRTQQKPLLRPDEAEESKTSKHSTGPASLGLDSSVSFDLEAADNNIDRMLRDMADNMIGRNVPFNTPFGVKAQVYADYTASGKSLECIERFMHDHVMPTYGNTHTTTAAPAPSTSLSRRSASTRAAAATAPASGP
ncbi:hypothetical protein ON010_g10267 [Phytophthora cinnamomi]|nr:hypothetical protein ON010_g10267 [Phytophthora cinnamomi]